MTSRITLSLSALLYLMVSGPLLNLGEQCAPKKKEGTILLPSSQIDFNLHPTTAKLTGAQAVTSLPLLNVLYIDSDKVILDKGDRDGVKVGDDVEVYRDEQLRGKVGRLRVTKIRDHECEAAYIYEGGISPGDVGILIRHSSVQDPVNRVDPHATALLKKLDATYKKMRSFSVEFDEGVLGENGDISFASHSQIAFRRPDHFTLTTTTGSETSGLIMDGMHSYLMPPSMRGEYTELPYSAFQLFNTPFNLIHRLGVTWLDLLLGGEGIVPKDHDRKLVSLSSKKETLVDGTPVETITAHWVSTEGNHWDIFTYTIGIRDHLLYQVSTQQSHYPTNRVVRYLHPQANTKLQDTVFALPQNATHLPLLHVVTVREDTVTLDKGSLDGVAVGDLLAVFTDEKLVSCNAELMITETQGQACTATILRNTGGVFPGEVCIITQHHK